MRVIQASEEELRRYYEALAIDRDFSAALEAEYGKRAGDMRYQPAVHPPHIRALGDALRALR